MLYQNIFVVNFNNNTAYHNVQLIIGTRIIYNIMDCLSNCGFSDTPKSFITFTQWLQLLLVNTPYEKDL